MKQKIEKNVRLSTAYTTS